MFQDFIKLWKFKIAFNKVWLKKQCVFDLQRPVSLRDGLVWSSNVRDDERRHLFSIKIKFCPFDAIV